MFKIKVPKIIIVCLHFNYLSPTSGETVFSFQFAVHNSHLLIDVTQTVDGELKTEN
jgi:hypothetical protein